MAECWDVSVGYALVLGRIRRLWYWITAQDPTLTFDYRLARWVNVAAAIGILATSGGWVVGWTLNLPWFVGLLIGLVAWVLVLNGFVARGRRSLQRAAPSDRGRTIRIPTAESFDQLKNEVRQMKIDLQQSEQQRAELAAERDALAQSANRTSVPRHDRMSDEDLRLRCLELAESLHDFLEDNALNEADRAEMIGTDFQVDVARADIRTMNQFRKDLKPAVMGTLVELKRRGWWDPQNLADEVRESLERPAEPSDLTLIANLFEELGYGL